MRWKAKEIRDWRKWHRWFAWHPVRVDGEWVWLEEIERRGRYLWDDFFWNYRNPSDGESS